MKLYVNYTEFFLRWLFQSNFADKTYIFYRRQKDT